MWYFAWILGVMLAWNLSQDPRRLGDVRLAYPSWLQCLCRCSVLLDKTTTTAFDAKLKNFLTVSCWFVCGSCRCFTTLQLHSFGF